MTLADLKPGFSWPGGKAEVADLVWRRFGNVDNYIEPFMGSLAVLLRRPPEHFACGRYRVETANDKNAYVSNYFRAVARDPDQVAHYADNPVHEADLHARHTWLVRSEEAAAWREKMTTDPDHFDAKIAGWWVWGQCAWIGSGWCDKGVDWKQVPLMSNGSSGNGVNCLPTKMPELGQPHGAVGRGVNGGCAGRPQLTDVFDIGRGVLGGAPVLHNKRPNFPDAATQGIGVLANPLAGACDARRAWLTDWMRRLSDRLRLVRTCYGHWSRVCDSKSTLTRLGTTGVFLDPPYPLRSKSGKKSRANKLYATDAGSDLDALRDEVLDWCVRWGGDSDMRVAVCGYEGDGYEKLVGLGWEEVPWVASGGYGNQAGKKSDNAGRERIWFSPQAVDWSAGPTLFDNLTLET